ncbi:MAG TPA: hypothetical protein DCM87_17120 [Planctomycetes bacterium]|nr:hypothetical protein [Planctomycetota bacterium]
MLETLATFFLELWQVLGEMAPYLLFGFLAAGVLAVAIPPEAVERHLGGRGLWPAVKAAVFGIPLPLCSCAVIPVTASLMRHGASRSASIAFLLSTPQTGIDSILVTLSLLGPAFAIFRPIAAFVIGVAGGGLVALLDKEPAAAQAAAPAGCECHAAPCCREHRPNAAARVFSYGFVTLPRDIALPLLVGLAISGVIAIAVPADFFAGSLGTGATGMLLMMVLGLPLYVCATASVPIAAVLIAKGVSPGAALVFLMTGPATNAATIATVWKLMGRRTAGIYLGTVAVSALACGVLLDWIIVASGTEAYCHGFLELPPLVRTACAAALLIVLGAAMLPRRNAAPHAS